MCVTVSGKTGLFVWTIVRVDNCGESLQNWTLGTLRRGRGETVKVVSP